MQSFRGFGSFADRIDVAHNVCTMTTRNFPEKMFHIFGANGYKIHTSIIPMPVGTCRRYTIFVLKSVHFIVGYWVVPYRRGAHHL